MDRPYPKAPRRSAFLLAGSVAALLAGRSAQAASPFTWTNNSAATQTWTTAGNWDANGVDSGPGSITDVLNFFADTTTALANGNNLITTSVPTLTMNVLTLNGKGAAATGAANITIGSNATTWTLDGTTPTVNLNGVNGTQALNYTVATKLALAQANTLFTGSGTASFTFSGQISGSGGITKTGSSTLGLSGANTYTGVTAINVGTVAISNGSALGTTAGNTTIAATGNTTAGGKLALSGGITSAENITISGVSDTSSFTRAIENTSGTNVLSGNITLAGATGAIRLGAAGGSLTFSGTITQNTTFNSLILNTGSANASVIVNNAIHNDGAGLTVYGANAASNFVQLNGVSGSGLGGTTVAQFGTLKLGVTNALNTTASLTLGQGTGQDTGTFDLAGFNQTVNALGGNAGALPNTSRVVTNSAASGTSTLTVGNGNGSGTFNGVLVDGATAKVALTKTGSGTETLAGQSTFSGTTLVSAGTLALGDNLALQNSAIDTSGAGAITLTGFTTPTFGGLVDGAGQHALASVITTGYSGVTQVTLNPGTGVSDSYSGVIANGAAGMNLVKTGAGTQALAGANTYTGSTTVSAGALIVSGSLNGSTAVSVAAGATLASGSSGGSITTGATTGNAINVTGTLSPGGTALAPITLTLAGTSKLNFNDGSQLRLDVAAAGSSDTVVFGSAGDWLTSSGNVTLALNGTVDYTSTYTVFSNVTTAGFTFANITGFDSADFTANFFEAGNSYQLSFLAIPEPNTAMSLLGGLGMLVSLRRLRRRR